MEIALAQVGPTLLFNLGLALIVGVLSSCYWIRHGDAAWREPLRRRLSGTMTVSLAITLAATLLVLWAEAVTMADVGWWEAGSAFKEVIVSTAYGHAGLVIVGTLAVAIVVHLAFARTGQSSAWLASLLLLLLLVVAARLTTGHAFEKGPMSAAVWLEGAHLLLMALWTGLVFVAGWIVLPQMRRAEVRPTPERAAYLDSMSNWAAAALAGILATGAYNSYRVLGNLRDILDTEYGHVLALKLALVALAIALGGFNKFIGLPAAVSTQVVPVDSRRGLRVVIAVLRIESVILLLVLSAAAVLTSSAQAG